MTDDDEARFRHRIRTLESFGHRGSATQHEQQAADYLVDQLREIGLEPIREKFYGGRSFGARIVVHVAVAAFGGCLLWHLPAIAILSSLIALASLLAEQATRGAWLSRPLLRHPSCNVVSRVPTEAARLRLVLVAHYDTQRSGLIWSMFKYLGPLFWWLPTILKPPLLPLALAMIGQMVLGAAALWWSWNSDLTIAAYSILATYAIYLLFLAEWAIGPFVPGAGDNASGAAALLALAEAWRRDPLDEVELLLLLTGCEESGFTGAATWSDLHRKEIAEVPTIFLNLDNFGFGPPRFLGAEVPLCGLPIAYPPSLIDAARATALDIGQPDAGPHTMPGPTDGLALLKRGIPGMTIVSFGKHGYLPNYHQMKDTSHNLDLDAAWTAVEFGWALLRRLASDASFRSPASRRAP